MMHYLDGDYPRLLEDADAPELADVSPQLRFQARLELGQFDKAAEELAAIEGPSDSFHPLRLAVAWRATGKAQQADEWLEKACQQLEADEIDNQRAAALLRGATTASWSDIQDVSLDPTDKVVFLLALAQLSPDKRNDLLALAERLNYSPTFSHHFNRRIIGMMRDAEAKSSETTGG